MNNDDRFEQLWNDYLEGELDENRIAELQRLLASDDSFLRAAADGFRVHRLLGLKAEDSETRHEEFVSRVTGERAVHLRFDSIAEHHWADCLRWVAESMVYDRIPDIHGGREQLRAWADELEARS